MNMWGGVTLLARRWPLCLLVIFLMWLPASVHASTFECAPTHQIDSQSDFFSYNGSSYSPGSLLSFGFSPASTTGNYYLAVTMYDDSCNTIPDLNIGRVSIPGTSPNVHARFVSTSEFDVIDDASGAVLYAKTFPTLPPYVRVSVRLTPYINGTGDAIDTEVSSIKQEATPPSVSDAGLTINPACPAHQAAGGRFGDFFDRTYERALYVNGLLRVQLRMGTVEALDAIRYAGVSTYDPDCNLTGPATDKATALYKPTEDSRYFSFRMVTPTQWQLWDDEREVPVVCTNCSGTIAPEASFVSFRVYNPANQAEPHYVFTTPYAPTEHTVCTVNCNSNVLFLPGIEASRLYDTEGVDGEKRLWEPANDADASQLSMTTAGESLRSDIYTRDVLDEAYVPIIGPNIYKSFIVSMNDLKSSGTINDWAAVPYDWRLSLEQILTSGNKTGENISYTSATSSPYVLQELQRLAASSRTGKVTIIAHSNGGLVAKALMQEVGPVETAKLIDKVIFVAVPHIGTSLTAASLLHGEELGIAPLLSANASRIIGQNMPGIYNLLPSADYFSNVTNPVIAFDPATMSDWISKYGSTIHDSTGLRAFMTDSTRIKPVLDDLVTPEINNPVLFDAAQSVHEQLDSWIPPADVQVIEIAGWGNETLSGIVYKKVRTSCVVGTAICFGGYALTYNPQHVIDGDGTVVTASALWGNGTTSMRYWVDVKKSNDEHPFGSGFAGRAHRDILEVPQLRALIINILTATTTAPIPQYISTSVPSFTGVENRLHFTLHSPLTLGFTDVSGNYTGATATSTIFNIPGVQYEKYGDVQWISVPANIPGKLVMQGTASGSFTLDAEEASGNDVLSTTSFEGISSATSSIATIDIDPAVSVTASSTLLVDQDGNGSVDLALHSKENDVVIPDLTAPITTTSATGTLGLNDWYRSSVQVTFNATDSESGVKNTYYSLDGAATTTGTTTSITANGIHLLRFYSDDSAGNIEQTASATVKVDMVAPEATVSLDAVTKDLAFIGTDDLTSTTITKTATTTTITDRAGNSTILKFQKTYSRAHLTLVRLISIQYGTSSPNNLHASLANVWDANHVLVSQTLTADSQFVVQALYNKRSNKTTIMVLKKATTVQRKVISGLALLKLTTNKGVMGYGW